jgi:hypothetical protein
MACLAGPAEVFLFIALLRVICSVLRLLQVYPCTSSLFRIHRTVESTMRSLNNLLERFHQSFFFYMLPSPWRYISIGVYMPPFLVMCAGLVLSAVALWLQSGDWLYYRPMDSAPGTFSYSHDVKECSSDCLRQLKNAPPVGQHLSSTACKGYLRCCDANNWDYTDTEI